MKILLSAFKMDQHGVSESYLAYKWYEYLSKKFTLNVITSSPSDEIGVFCEELSYSFKNKLLNKANSAVKFDYFIFNRSISKKFESLAKESDILHHVSPVAPRYPVSLSKFSNRFVLGPIGGGLRVPVDFRKEVEGSEEWFYKLRNLDKIRFSLDRELKETYERADVILCAGEYMREILPYRYSHKLTEFLDVGVDVVDYKYFQRSYNGELLKLLYVGRVVPYKGLMFLLKAISGLSQFEKKSILLTIVGFKGESKYEKECLSYIKNNGLFNQVEIVGYIPKSEALSYYESADVFCFPSLAEAGGTVVLEAMASGLPVLAAKVGGPVTSITSDSGILVDCAFKEQFVDGLRLAISSILNGNICLSSLSYHARKRVEERFTWEARLEQISKIYESII